MSESRYANVGSALWSTADGRQVPYLRRRLLPQPGVFQSVRVHIVRSGERCDTIAAAELGDPELSWLLADANGAISPSQLEQPGASVRIPLPTGVPVTSDGQ